MDRSLCTVEQLIDYRGCHADTMRQIESHLLMRHYDGFLKKGKIRSGR